MACAGPASNTKNFSAKNHKTQPFEKKLCKTFPIHASQPSMSKLNKYQFRRSDHYRPQIARFRVGQK